MKLFPLLAAFLLAASPPSLATSPADQATTFLRQAVDEALVAIYDGPAEADIAERIRPVLDRHIAYALTTQRSVGPAWRQFSPPQRERIITLFTDVLIRTYTRRLTGDDRPAITLASGTDLRARQVEVPAVITYQGSRYDVLFRLEEIDAGWRVYDLIGEGVSLIANYRSQLDPIARRGGADAVINALEKNLTDPPSSP